MPSQNIPLKGRTDSGDPAEFRPQRLFAFELRRWEAQLGPSARISAGCLRWQELPRFSADAEMIRRQPIQQYYALHGQLLPQRASVVVTDSGPRRLAPLPRQRPVAPNQLGGLLVPD